jgi:hypothetical protein
MPEQDNVSMEKISLGAGDFADDLGENSFGIQDTQVLASKDLQNFLLGDPDDVKNIAEEEEKQKQQQQQQTQQQQQQTQTQKQTEEGKGKDKTTTKQEDKPSGTDTLENILFGKEKEEGGAAPDKTTTSTENTEDEDSTYATLGKDLMRLGVFSKNTEEESEENLDIKTPEQFLERFNLEKKKGAINILDNFLSQFGEDYRKMFDAVFVNGVKPQEYIQSFAKIEAISNIDLTQEGNQERVVRAYYKNLKWDDNKIETKIQKLKDYGDLEDESKAYHEVLLNKEKEQAAALELTKQEEARKQKEKETTTQKSYERILAQKLKDQEIDGIPLTEKDSKEVLSYLTDKKYKLQSGELLSEFDKDLLELNRPENHELKIKLGLLLRKKLDLTSVKKTTISKKSDALFTLSTKNAKQNPKEKEIKSFF